MGFLQMPQCCRWGTVEHDMRARKEERPASPYGRNAASMVSFTTPGGPRVKNTRRRSTSLSVDAGPAASGRRDSVPGRFAKRTCTMSFVTVDITERR